MKTRRLKRAVLLACGLLLAMMIVQSGLPWRLMEPQAQRDAALVATIRQGDEARVQSLLNRGANANARDADGQYALSVAAETPVVSTVHGMSVNGQCVTLQKHQGYEQIVTALVEYGANANVRNRHQITPLQQAQSFEEVNVVRLLKHAGAIE